MATNLFKPEAKRRQDAREFHDALIGFAILIAFIAACCYIGIRASEMNDNKTYVKPKYSRQP